MRLDWQLRKVWHDKVEECREELAILRHLKDKACKEIIAGKYDEEKTRNSIFIAKRYFELQIEDVMKEEKRYLWLLKLTSKSKKEKKGFIDPETVKWIPLDEIFITQWITAGTKRKKTCCPLHNEDSPSFIWYVDQNTWHCFGCNIGGDIIDFVMRRDNKTFREAVHLLNPKG